MMNVKLECEDVRIEELLERLKTTNWCRAWTYREKVYVIAKVNSLSVFQSLLDGLMARRVKFRVAKVEKPPWWKMW